MKTADCIRPKCDGVGRLIPDRDEVQCVKCGAFCVAALWDEIPRVPKTRQDHVSDPLAAFLGLAIEGAQDVRRQYLRGDPALRTTVKAALLTMSRAVSEIDKAQQLTLVG